MHYITFNVFSVHKLLNTCPVIRAEYRQVAGDMTIWRSITIYVNITNTAIL